MRLTDFNPAEHIKRPTDAIWYLEAVAASDDKYSFLRAIEDVSRALKANEGDDE